MKNDFYGLDGLTESQVTENRLKFGENILREEKANGFLKQIGEVVTEPMFLLLIAACLIYFLVGEYAEGVIMLVAMLFVASISFFQESRSKKALDAVRRMSAPVAKVIRNGKVVEVSSEMLVVNDIIIAEEGEQIPADGRIVRAHDFSVDESVLTGESVPVTRDASSEVNTVYLGSTVRTGHAAIQITQVGVKTLLGKLGKSIEEISTGQSRFRKEIRSFIRMMAIIGTIAFLFVFSVNYFSTHQLLTSLLFALALAMSILPEEIPVAFSTFMALGSWRLLKEDVLAKDPQVVETLGSATVICVDKTGTITENRMTVSRVFSYSDKSICSPDSSTDAAKQVIAFAMWASEPSPFDPMEIAIHAAYGQTAPSDVRNAFEMIHEYPLAGLPPVMTHVYEDNKGSRIIACKGGAEAVIRYCGLGAEDAKQVMEQVKSLASEGYRVLGVARASFEGTVFPAEQKDFPWCFEGLIGLYDPPKSNIREVLGKFYDAGIQVKIISGDFPETTRAIAREIGFKGAEAVTDGNEVMNMPDAHLKEFVREKYVFARMFPEAKLRVVNALKANGEIVAMTGDGVNDGPALKAADIGVSMGSKGTEIAKRAASIVLLNNDLSGMYVALIAGRKIYINLKKAIRYILSIHISIILSVIVPLILDWRTLNIFLPVHIIFFELIMGPTCSIIYENEPVENDTAHSTPHAASASLLGAGELFLSILQGLFISFGVLLVYYFSMMSGDAPDTTRTIVFSVIVFANIFLTLENRSFRESIFRTIRYKNPLIYIIVFITGLLLLVILSVPAVRNLFLLAPLQGWQLLICLAAAVLSVFWIELYKLARR